MLKVQTSSITCCVLNQLETSVAVLARPEKSPLQYYILEVMKACKRISVSDFAEMGCIWAFLWRWKKASLNDMFLCTVPPVCSSRRTVAGPRRRSPTWRRRCPWLSSSCYRVGRSRRRRTATLAVSGKSATISPPSASSSHAGLI